MTKSEIVERPLTVEQAYAELIEHLVYLQFELLETQQHEMEQQRQQKFTQEKEKTRMWRLRA